MGCSDEVFDDDNVGLEELGEEEEVLSKQQKDVCVVSWVDLGGFRMFWDDLGGVRWCEMV